MKDILLVIENPAVLKFENALVSSEVGLPLLKLARPNSIAIKHYSEESTNELLEICDRKLIFKNYFWRLDVVHLQVQCPSFSYFNESFLLRLKPHLKSLQVLPNTMETVIACEGLKLNKFVIECENWSRYNADCLKGLLQVSSRSSELRSTTISMKELMDYL